MRNLKLMFCAFLTGAFMLSMEAAHAGKFDGVTVKLAIFGGKWRDAVDKHVTKPFEAEGGKIEYVLGQPAQNMAKLIAARGQAAPFDLYETMDNFLPGLAEGGYVGPLDLNKIPNAADLVSRSYADANKVMIWMTQEGIVYNTEKFKELGIPKPTRYSDLLNPKLKGKVSIPDISAGGAIPALIGMAHETGGSETNIDPALDLIVKIQAKSYWSSQSNLHTMLVGGDIWAAAAQAGNVQRLKGQVPLGMSHIQVAGKTGVIKQGYLVKIKGTKQSDAVDWIINQFLSLSMQIATSTETGQVPVTKAALSELRKDTSLQGVLRLTPEEITSAYYIDYSKVDQAAYVQKWNRKIGRR